MKVDALPDGSKLRPWNRRREKFNKHKISLHPDFVEQALCALESPEWQPRKFLFQLSVR
jgi:hypothetical protein